MLHELALPEALTAQFCAGCGRGRLEHRGCAAVACGAVGSREHPNAKHQACSQPPGYLPWSLGFFPEDEVPEKAYRSLQGGRRERKAKKRLPKSRLQNKTGRTSGVT